MSIGQGYQCFSVKKATTGLDSADIDSYASILRQCNLTRNLSLGQAVHKKLAQVGMDRVTVLSNLMIQMYGSCRCVAEASRIFTSITDPDDFSWNVMIAAYAKNGHLAKAKVCFDRMPSGWRGVFTFNTVIVAYAREGKVCEARSLFDQMPNRNTFSWNAMISAYARGGDPRRALELWSKMDLAPDKITLVSALNACCAVADLEEGKNIHAKIRNVGLERDIILATALVNLYGKCGLAIEAKAIFLSVADSQDTVLWTAMQMALVRSGRLIEARDLFDRMPRRDVVSWTAMLVADASAGDLERSAHIFASMPEKNSVSWNAMIAAYAQHGRPRDAIHLFLAMDCEGFGQDSVTFVSIFDACSSVADLSLGKTIHGELLDLPLQIDASLGTAIVNMYAKSGDLGEARRLFDSIRERNIWSWNTMLTGYAQRGHTRSAVDLFALLNLDGQDPDEVSFLALFSACSHGGLLRHSHALFQSIAGDYGQRATISHYVCLIDLLGRAGKLGQAEELLHAMPFEPTPSAWTALLNGCEIHRDVDRARRVPKHALGDEDLGPYILLSNVIWV